MLKRKEPAKVLDHEIEFQTLKAENEKLQNDKQEDWDTEVHEEDYERVKKKFKELHFDRHLPYARKPVQHDPTKPFQMMITDVTYLMDQATYEPELRIWGVTENKNSAVVCVRDFFPYFYVEIPDLLAGRTHRIIEKLEQKLRQHNFSKYQQISSDLSFVKGFEVYNARNLMGYPAPQKQYLKITMRCPHHISTARKMFEHKVCFPEFDMPTYEGNIAFVVRFMVDLNIAGMQWIQVEPGPQTHISFNSLRFNVQMEISASKDAIRPIDTNLKGEIAPMRMCSFDGEMCKVSNGGRGFVNPKDDPISQWACVLREGSEIIDHVVFSLVPRGKSVKQPVYDSDTDTTIRIEEFEDERNLLYAIRDYFIVADIDCFTGYNINGFDWWYIFERAKKLGIFDDWSQFSREKNRKCRAQAAMFNSKAYGARKDYALHCEGRWDFDMLKFLTRSEKFRSYTLSYVAEELLGDAKVEMPYRLIPIYQAGTDKQRAHLCLYCWKDAALCFDLMDNRMALGKFRRRRQNLPQKTNFF